MIPLSLLRAIERWLLQHMPVWCARCGDVHMAKNMSRQMVTTGAVVSICPKCERELYHPWERGK